MSTGTEHSSILQFANVFSNLAVRLGSRYAVPFLSVGALYAPPPHHVDLRFVRKMPRRIPWPRRGSMRHLSYLLCGLALFVLHLDCASARSLTVNITARVTYVYDPGNVLGGQAYFGQTASGSYVYETAVPDQYWDPTYGQYLQTPSQARARLTLGSLAFESDNSVLWWSFRVEVLPDQGLVQVISPMNKPLANGASVMAFDINYSALQGTFTTDALPTAAPKLSDFVSRQVYLSGELDGNWYNLILEITEVEAPDDGLVVSPGSGPFVPQQRFDAALLLPAGSMSRNVQASRGGVILPTQCYPAQAAVLDRRVIVCPDAHSLLQAGSGPIEWRVEMQDDSVLTKEVNWESVQ
jgi:hypothetical protein